MLSLSKNNLINEQFSDVKCHTGIHIHIHIHIHIRSTLFGCCKNMHDKTVPVTGTRMSKTLLYGILKLCSKMHHLGVKEKKRKKKKLKTKVVVLLRRTRTSTIEIV
jgi:hypothetical protein